MPIARRLQTATSTNSHISNSNLSIEAPLIRPVGPSFPTTIALQSVEFTHILKSGSNGELNHPFCVYAKYSAVQPLLAPSFCGTDSIHIRHQRRQHFSCAEERPSPVHRAEVAPSHVTLLPSNIKGQHVRKTRRPQNRPVIQDRTATECDCLGKIVPRVFPTFDRGNQLVEKRFPSRP